MMLRQLNLIAKHWHKNNKVISALYNTQTGMEIEMIKLLVKFQSNPTIENAIKVQQHIRKHPFAPIVLTGELHVLLNQALDLIEKK